MKCQLSDPQFDQNSNHVSPHSKNLERSQMATPEKSFIHACCHIEMQCDISNTLKFYLSHISQLYQNSDDISPLVKSREI